MKELSGLYTSPTPRVNTSAPSGGEKPLVFSVLPPVIQHVIQPVIQPVIQAEKAGRACEGRQVAPPGDPCDFRGFAPAGDLCRRTLRQRPEAGRAWGNLGLRPLDPQEGFPESLSRPVAVLVVACPGPGPAARGNTAPHRGAPRRGPPIFPLPLGPRPGLETATADDEAIKGWVPGRPPARRPCGIGAPGP